MDPQFRKSGPSSTRILLPATDLVNNGPRIFAMLGAVKHTPPPFALMIGFFPGISGADDSKHLPAASRKLLDPVQNRESEPHQELAPMLGVERTPVANSLDEPLETWEDEIRKLFLFLSGAHFSPVPSISDHRLLVRPRLPLPGRPDGP